LQLTARVITTTRIGLHDALQWLLKYNIKHLNTYSYRLSITFICIQPYIQFLPTAAQTSVIWKFV